MARFIAILSVLFAADAVAQPCDSPAGSESSLYAAANSLGPGEACVLSTQLTEAMLRGESGGNPVQWTDSGSWLSDAREIHWIGRDAGCGDGRPPTVHLIYDESSNEWATRRVPFNPCGHGYDGNAADDSGRVFFRAYAEDSVHIFEGGEWSRTPSMTGYAGSPAIGLAYAVMSRSLLWAQLDSLWVLEDGSTTWSEITLPEPIGTYHNMAEYNPVTGSVVFGGGNGQGRRLYRFGADGHLSALSPAPTDIGIHGTHGTYFTVDPVSGQYLVYAYDTRGGTNRWWAFDAESDRWSSAGDGLPALSAKAFHVPIPAYGVIVFFDSRPPAGGEPVLWVYRHEPSVLPPPTPGRDAGPAADAGTPVDAGPSLDGGPRDVGMMTLDAGGDGMVGHDASVPPDGASGCSLQVRHNGTYLPWLLMTALLFVRRRG